MFARSRAHGADIGYVVDTHAHTWDDYQLRKACSLRGRGIDVYCTCKIHVAQVPRTFAERSRYGFCHLDGECGYRIRI